jgi:hypothetical protein
MKSSVRTQNRPDEQQHSRGEVAKQNMETTQAFSTFSSLKIDEWLIKQIKNLGIHNLIH